MNFSVVNLGCKVNRVESDSFAATLIAQGGKLVPEAQAQLIVVNTCTVTGEAEKKTRKAVRHALRASAHANVLVTGCAVAIDAATYEAMSARVEVVPKGEVAARIESIVQEKEHESNLQVSQASCRGDLEIARSGEDGESASTALMFRTRVGVKVQDGCNNACTYCIVHVARGRATSRPADDIARECINRTREGAREIVLTGINLGSYCDGDRHSAQAVRLADLLKRLLDATASLHAEDELPVRFRVSSIEPRDVDRDLIDLLATSSGRICRHLHLPLQAGSSKVLREMARPYDAQRFLALVAELRQRVPGIALSTDIIVGFPGETDAEFQETLNVARTCRFEKIHVFPYSLRAGTPAAERLDQVPAPVKTERASTLRALANELRVQGLAERAGTTELALVEEGGVAMTESYYDLPAPEGATPGTLIELMLPACSEPLSVQ